MMDGSRGRHAWKAAWNTGESGLTVFRYWRATRCAPGAEVDIGERELAV